MCYASQIMAIIKLGFKIVVDTIATVTMIAAHASILSEPLHCVYLNECQFYLICVMGENQ